MNGKYYPDRPDTYVLFRPCGDLFFGPATHNECFEKLHKSQSMSIDWAMRHEGWVWLHADDADGFAAGWQDGLLGKPPEQPGEARRLGNYKAREYQAFMERCKREAEQERRRR